MLEPLTCTALRGRPYAKRWLGVLLLLPLMGSCSTDGSQTGDEGKHSGGDAPSPGGSAGAASGAGGRAMAGAANGGKGGASGAGSAGSAAGGAPSCATPCGLFSCCDGSCVNLDNDINNCGGCAIKCAGEAPFCDQGACGAPACALVGAACPLGETCCVDQCCGAGELCCNVHENFLRTQCYAAVQGTCPVGCPDCD